METEPTKETEPKGPKARLVFRWLAGVVSLVCFFLAVLQVFPQAGQVAQPEWETFALMVAGGGLFGTIALTGYLRDSAERSEFSKRVADARSQLKAGKGDDADQR